MIQMCIAPTKNFITHSMEGLFVHSFIHSFIHINFIHHIPHHYDKVKEVNEADGKETWKKQQGL